MTHTSTSITPGTAKTGTAAGTARVAVYGRQSLGKASSIEQQLDLGHRRAEAEGWTVHAVYQDGVSASRHGRLPRADWAKLLGDVKAARVGVIWLWESSRGDRRASTWLTLLEDCREVGVRIYIETHGRLYDMSNPRDWRSLAEDGTDNEYESEKIRQRVNRSMQARAEAGQVHGRTPYGYERRYELTPAGRRVLVGQLPHPVEAPIVVEMYQRLARGESLRALARDLEARGVRTRSGVVFSSQQIRDMVLRHTYAGVRAHALTGTIRSHHPGAKAETVTATWPALVPLELWHGVRTRLMDPARRTSRPGRAVHPYSMIACCDVCGGPLTVRFPRAETGEYFCRNASHVRVGKPELETYLDGAITKFLARPKAIAGLRRDDDGDRSAEAQRVRDALAEARAQLQELRDEVGAGRLSVASLVAAEPGILARVEVLEKQDRELTTPPALAALLAAGPDAALRWRDTPVAAQREVARLLFSADVLGQVRLARVPVPGYATPIEDRVIFARIGRAT